MKMDIPIRGVSELHYMQYEFKTMAINIDILISTAPVRVSDTHYTYEALYYNEINKFNQP